MQGKGVNKPDLLGKNEKSLPVSMKKNLFSFVQRRWRRTNHYISGSCISLDSHVIMDRHSISSEGCPV